MSDRDRYRAARVHGVYFEPWKGKQYGYTSSWGLPVLIVSESHYEYDEDRQKRGELLPRNETTFVIEHRASEEEPRPHATKIAISFVGRRPQRNPPGEMYEFWNSVAFYNFIQEGMAHLKQHPTAAAFHDALEGFWTVLSELKPGLVIVFSRRVWDELQPNRSEKVPVFVRDGMIIAGLPHPQSRAFGNARNWYPVICDLLNQAKHQPSASTL